MNFIAILSIRSSANIRLIDSINKVDKLIDRAVELGLSGICITEHESLSSHIKAFKHGKKIREKYPDFKVGLGNEIYLCENREKGQKYYHFILIAKNKKGYKALRELSSRAWMNVIEDRRMERVITTYDDLKEITKKYPNSLIGSTACLGSELSQRTLSLIETEELGAAPQINEAHEGIVDFMLMCKEVFGEDFYLECQPAQSREQILVNKRFPAIAKAFGVKMIVTCDAHYLKKEDRYVHKAYLNSKEGEREVDAFYQYAYLQSNEEIYENLEASGYSKEFVDEMFSNSHEIYDKIENFDLYHTQVIPKIEPKVFDKSNFFDKEKYPVLHSLETSDNLIERNWVNECWNGLKEHKKENNDEYLKRVETEADIIKYIGNKINECLFSYFVTFKHYIDLFWECGSIVGPGRGSACGFLSNYLLGITQVDPIEWDLAEWRFLNKERVELPDIDIDLCPSKRPNIVQKIREDREKNNLSKDLDEQSRKNLGCVGVATFGTEGTRSTVQTACRGYRSEDFPDGIDNDIALYLTSLIPEERGFLWPLEDVLKGNKEKDRKPIHTFVKEVEKYPGLVDIMLGIQNLVNKRSSHASGFIFLDGDPYDYSAFMRAPNGDITTQLDLEESELSGLTKFDLLATKISDKIVKTIELLKEDNVIEDKSLKETYYELLHPSVIDIKDNKIWEALGKGAVLDVFQFDSSTGGLAARKIKPQSPLEMMSVNATMRLMPSEKGAESPLDKYNRFKNNYPFLWEKEMENYGVTEEERKSIEHIYVPNFGVPCLQEDLMILLMENANFSLKEANSARKIVAKKKMDKIPELRKMIFERVPHEGFANYLWDTGIKPQLGYAFSKNHSLPYSFVGIQTLLLATKFNSIYWNTACLIVNSGSLEQQEDDKKEKGTDYGKVAKAIGEIRSRGIKVSLADINKSSYGFKPNVKDNEILFGLKGMNKIGDSVVDEIIKNRPYKSIKEFMRKCPLNKTQMESLIKGGAFDRTDYEWASKINKDEPRKIIMSYYLSQICDNKKRLTLQNLKGLIDRNLIPESLKREQSIFEFNRYLKLLPQDGDSYLLDERSDIFLKTFDEYDSLIDIVDSKELLNKKKWEKIYKSNMDSVRAWLKANQEDTLDMMNTLLFKETWDKYASGTLSYWEMQSLCFYHGPHELANLDINKYGISNFNDLNSEPDVARFFKKKGVNIPIYNIYRIVGTVIGKNKSHSSISLLTTEGVVEVKFNRDLYAMFDKQISQKQADGTKKVIEKGWFTKGTKLMVSGFRRDKTFVCKTYKSTRGHHLYKITEVVDGGRGIKVTFERESE